MEDKAMHDWTLKNIEVAWRDGVVRLDLVSSPGVTKCLTARDLIELVVPRRQEWGPSESIMSSNGPEPHDDGQRLEILMQSGDSLLIIAREITMPPID
jgi:hypothetical protein